MITYTGRQVNLAVRQAAFFALAINLLMVVTAIISIIVTIPVRHRGEAEIDADARAVTKNSGAWRPT